MMERGRRVSTGYRTAMSWWPTSSTTGRLTPGTAERRPCGLRRERRRVPSLRAALPPTLIQSLYWLGFCTLVFAHWFLHRRISEQQGRSVMDAFTRDCLEIAVERLNRGELDRRTFLAGLAA